MRSIPSCRGASCRHDIPYRLSGGQFSSLRYRDTKNCRFHLHHAFEVTKNRTIAITARIFIILFLICRFCSGELFSIRAARHCRPHLLSLDVGAVVKLVSDPPPAAASAGPLVIAAPVALSPGSRSSDTDLKTSDSEKPVAHQPPAELGSGSLGKLANAHQLSLVLLSFALQLKVQPYLLLPSAHLHLHLNRRNQLARIQPPARALPLPLFLSLCVSAFCQLTAARGGWQCVN
jgi:hypothetical protein